MEATLIDGLVAHCQSGRFTGILRVRARQGIGEVWFLSGVADEVQFGTSTADEAMGRMRKATDATYELVSRLPHPGGGFKRRFPSKGSIATATPVTLMRYCEQYALTCTLAVESGGELVEARYELGDLVSVETTADDDGITAMLEAKEGSYEFTLPRVELPAGTPVLPPAPSSLLESLPPPESLGFRELLETKALVRRPARNEAEVKRKTVEIARQQKSAPTRTVPRAVAASKQEAKPATTLPKVAEAAAPLATEKPKAATLPKVEPETPPVEAPEVKAPDAKAADAKAADVKAADVKAADAKKEEPKPAAAPLAEDNSKESEPAKKRMPKPPAPAKRSLAWFVVPLLVAVGLVYLFWTHRI